MAQIKLTYTDQQGQIQETTVDIPQGADFLDQWLIENLGYIPDDVQGEYL